ncbi:MAG: DoxX family protein [Alphaproteobacteria bacterium]|nr:DoxX family protein [Alphaproteobacteria bacterium]
MAGRARVATRDPINLVRGAIAALETWVAPLVDLAVRLWIARVFFNSGLAKIDDWNSTIFLFELEYQVPILPPAAAATLATIIELGMPVLLILGLFARLAALPLLGMALVIQFVLGASNPAYDHVEHFYWMLLLLIIIVRGAGALSLDRLLARRFLKTD